MSAVGEVCTEEQRKKEDSRERKIKLKAENCSLTFSMQAKLLCA